jgi:hypothetical protein
MAPVGNSRDGISTQRKNRATAKRRRSHNSFVTAAEQFQDDLRPSSAKTVIAYRIADVRRASAVTE